MQPRRGNPGQHASLMTAGVIAPLARAKLRGLAVVLQTRPGDPHGRLAGTGATHRYKAVPPAKTFRFPQHPACGDHPAPAPQFRTG